METDRETPPPVRMIVNADDLGRTPGINDGIFAAHERGLVTSTTLMVAYKAAREAAECFDRYPSLGIGLHVALSGGEPLLPARQIPSLVDGQGRLARDPDHFATLDPGEVLAEVEAQIARFRELIGRLPTHLDSHHHAHRHPVVCAALITIAKREGLPVRNTSPAVGEKLRAAGIATTDSFVARFYGAEARLEPLLEIIGGLTPGVTEVMCHPARIDDLLRQGSSYVDEREVELAVLSDPRAMQAVEERGAELIHFGAL